MNLDLDHVGQAMREALGEAPEGSSRRAVAATEAARALRAQQRRRQVLVAGLALLLVGGGVLGWSTRRPALVGVTVDEVPLVSNGWVDRPDGAQVRFDDDSRMSLAPESRMRVVTRERKNMHLILEGGRLEAAITPGGAWHLEAGPYVVHVIGTQFSVNWKARRLEVDVSHGVVEVVGGSLQARRVSVSAGERLVVDDARFSVEPLPEHLPAPAEEPPVPPPPDTAAEERPVLPPLVRSGATPSKARVGPESSLVALLRADERAAALALVEREGLERVMRSASASQWLMLCDAARVERRPELASRVCEGVRARFGGSVEAAEASFRLGRLAFDAERWQDAARWFHAMWSERPQHPLSSDALGREMESLARAGFETEARARALLVLERAPESPWAGRARSLLK